LEWEGNTQEMMK
ncbi:hypothetical protein CP8484711_1223C, partial [Chlamydia psittaci 84-8471/1]